MLGIPAVAIALLAGGPAPSEGIEYGDPVDVAAPSINARTGVRWYRDINYAGPTRTNPEKQVLDLYLPKEDTWMEGRPLLVWIHGGGWIIGDKDDAMGLYGRYCRKLAEHGIAAANIGYRLSPEVQHPSHIEDIAAATAWLVEHANQFGFDPARIFVSGHSAGGHLAALLAVDERWLKEEGVDPEVIIGAIPSSGVYDLRPLFEGRYSFGGAFPEGTAEGASPVSHLDASDPPFLLLVETYGRYMRDQTDTMVAGLKEAGVRHELIEVPSSNHITMLSDLAREDGISLTRTVDFVDTVLKACEASQAPTVDSNPAPPGGER